MRLLQVTNRTRSVLRLSDVPLTGLTSVTLPNSVSVSTVLQSLLPHGAGDFSLRHRSHGVISNEKFFKNVPSDVISFAKLRGSYGVLGDDGSIADFSYLMNYIFSTNTGYPIGGNFAPGLMVDPNNYPNKDLKWGKSKDMNFAIDLGTLNNRISASFEIYQRRRTNMVMSAPTYLFPPSSGTDGNVPSVNFGDVRFRGWDLSLSI